MNKTLLFIKRNLKEMLRDPLLYCFCGGFPVLMVLLFQLILHYSGESTPTFQLKSLIPGIMMFSYTLLMLMASLLISKDRSQAFLKRLFTSPMKGHNYIIGYFVPYFLVGIIQSIICVALGYIFSLINSTEFIPFYKSLLLILEMIPIMAINIFIGMSLGMILNDKTAPGITSVFISCSGILGGAWMPIDTMSEFETVCSFLPFYPSVYLGRVICMAKHTLPNELGDKVIYSYSDRGIIFLIVLIIYTILFALITLFIFNKKLKSDN